MPGQKRMLAVYALVFVLTIAVHQLFDPMTIWFRHQEAAEMIEDGILCVLTITIVMTLIRQSERRLAVVEEEHRRRFASFEALVSGIDSRILSNEPLAEILRFICERLQTLYRFQSVEIHLSHDDTPPAPGGIHVPIVAGERTLGDLIVRTDGCPPLSTLHELRGFAEQIALSLVAAGAHEQIRLQTVALESAANAILITNIHGVICWMNQAFTDLTGWAADDVLGHTPRILRSGNHSPTFYRQMWSTLLGGHVWRGEMYNRRRDGTLYPEEKTITPVRGKDDEITHFVAIKQDISERKDQEEQIRYLAMNDALTSLPNRRAFDNIVQRVIREADSGTRAALVIVDVEAVTDFVSARNWIRRMKELGFLFALDDFGSAFSSFAYLRALSVDYVKIDRSFIGDLDTNPTTRALVQAVNTVAHTLGKEVIAEGVETAIHAELLHQLGIEHGQGFHWGEPQCDIFAAATVP